MEEHAQPHVMPFQLSRAECDYTWLMYLRYPIVLAAVEHHFICVNETSIILWHDPADVKWVSANANGAQANNSSTGNLSVSDDGRSIFFGFDASNLVDGDSNNQHDFFVANNPLCEASGVGGTVGPMERLKAMKPVKPHYML